MASSQPARRARIFGQVLRTPDKDRKEFLEAACGGDSKLREEIEALLRADAEADSSFLARVPRKSNELELAGVSLIGRRIGAYRIVEKIDRGGMGEVYRGVRADRAYEQQVALKLMRLDLRSPDFHRRFQKERQTLARLEHPHIARLLDGGTTPEGTPYLVMEFVHGDRIDQYCDENRLPLWERIELFLQICRAVHFTHLNLILHRDLKPANILITPDGSAKLLDFGISKLLDPRCERDDTPDATTTSGPLPLTPRYCSPEQIRGERVTTGSDVYSLGILLYELLTGRHPYPENPSSDFERRRQACEVEPIRASRTVLSSSNVGNRNRDVLSLRRPPQEQALAELRATTPRLLSRRLRGDLDAILDKALKKCPSERYGSVLELTDELERARDGRAVRAHRSTLFDRTRKLLRRHRSLSWAAGLLLFTTVSGAISITRGMIRAKRAEAEALAVTRFLRETLSAADPYRAQSTERRVDLLNEIGNRIDTELTEHPEVEVEVRLAVSRAFSALWRWRDALPHQRRTLELLTERHGLASAQAAEGMTALGRSLAFLENPESLSLLRQALQTRRHLYGESHPEVAESRASIGFALWHAQDPPRHEEAIVQYEAALNLYRDLGHRIDTDVARFHFGLAMAQWSTGRIEEAERTFSRARTLYEQLPPEHGRIKCLDQNAAFLHSVGKHSESESLLETLLDILPDREENRLSIHPRIRLASLRRRAADSESAKQLHLEALRCRYLQFSPNCSHLRDRDAILELLAKPPLGSCGTLFSEAFEGILAHPHNPRTLSWVLEVAELLYEQGDSKSAAELCDKTLETLAQKPGGVEGDRTPPPIPSEKKTLEKTQRLLALCREKTEET